MIVESARVISSEHPDDIKVFRNVLLSCSSCGRGVIIGDDTTIERSTIGDHCSVNRRNYINDSFIGDFSYTGINTIINYSKIGKFCSIARNVDIGGDDHDMNRITTMPRYRFEQTFGVGHPASPHIGMCEIGNDVWIASGAIILHKAQIGDGAVIGAGAVVTKDVPPYAVAVGVPAKIVKFRCSEALIKRLMVLKWWDFPQDILESNMNYLFDKDISEETVTYLEQLKEEFRL